MDVSPLRIHAMVNLCKLTAASQSSREHKLFSRMVTAAASLIAKGGRDAATTRAVAVVAGVEAPTIYRDLGDNRALHDAVAEQALVQTLRSRPIAPQILI